MKGARRHGSEVKSSDFSNRGKKFNSQSPHGDSQPSTVLVLEDSTSGLCGHFTYTVERYMQAKHPHTLNKNKS